MDRVAAEISTAPILHVPEIGSTNEAALVRARAGDPGPFWIRADRQVSGRGRQGRTWISPAGNLYCTLMLRTGAPPADLPQLSQVAAVALVEALEGVVGRLPTLRIKWPNDLLLGRAKVAGILVEGTRTADGAQACVIGCGVNCSNAPTHLPYEVTSLSLASREVTPSDVFDRLQPAMGAAVALWDEGRGFAAIRARWLARALPLETELTVRSGPTPLIGRYRGIDTRGRLLLMGPDGPVTVEAGEVNLSEASAAAGG